MGDEPLATVAGTAVRVACATTFGPRVVHLSFIDGDNEFAVLDPHETASPPSGAPAVSLRGGHRLWTAPETPASYVPDDEAVEMKQGDRWISVCQPADSGRPLERTITVTVDAEAPVVHVQHSLCNHGRDPLRLAPWGITQLPPGGVGILPQPPGPRDDLGLQANRGIVLWPYTRMTDPRVWVADGAITLRGGPHPGVHSATAADHACKIGLAGDVPWAGYVRGGTAFVTRFAQPPGDYVDLGAGAQLYTDHRFCEVEALGPLVELAPEETVEHSETWELHRTQLDPMDDEQLTALLGELDRPLV